MLHCKNIAYQTSEWSANFSFTAALGQWIGVAGPSGGGKSTLLHLLAGFVPAQSGQLLDNDQNLLLLPPAKRQMNFMFQQNSLLPHLSARKNLNLALHDRKFSPDECEIAIQEACAVACLPSQLLDRKPYELSGGEIARVNLARTLLRPCRWLLLDEPFAALDAHHRIQILTHLNQWRLREKVGIFFISHDPNDALLMADKLLFIDHGTVVTEAQPQHLAQFPPTPNVARLLRTGTLFPFDGCEAFITPENLYTDPKQTTNTTDLTPLDCAEWQQTLLGATSLVIDLKTQQQWIVLADRKFAGTFYFSRNSLHFLKNEPSERQQ